MDFLDPKKQFRHNIILFLGYILIAIGITIGTLVLVYQAYGFGLGKNGTVIQNGLAFFSSQPHPADIYINGVSKSAQTNTRLSLPAGIYDIQLKRDGYHDWQRRIELNGGSVEHFDYPFLIPKKLDTKIIQNYPATPTLATQSPDHRWLIVSQPNSSTNLSLFDIKNPDKASTTLALPAGIVSKAAASESWSLGEWADDNQHVILQHIYDGQTEFILVDRVEPTRSLNLNETLQASPTKLTLKDKKYDQYYLYDAVEQSLKTASLKEPFLQTVLTRVAAYQSYGNNILLYVTDNGAAAGTVLVKLRAGDQTYPIRSLAGGSSYLLNLTKYSGTFYVAAGAGTSDKVYIYKDPVGQRRRDAHQAVVPIQVLHVAQPNYVSFSSNAQFIVVQNGTRFGVYDIENKTGYNYTRTEPMDSPQAHATWMDGNRLTYVSQGRLTVFDYDNTNRQTLGPASSAYLPVFAPNYKFVNTFAPVLPSGQTSLMQTLLLVLADR